jgi:hypothetical protein
VCVPEKLELVVASKVTLDRSAFGRMGVP